MSTIHTLEAVTKNRPWSDARAHLSVASAGRLAHHRRLPLRATVVMDPKPRGKSVADPLRRDAVELSNVSRLDQVRPATAHPLPPFEHQPADAQATATHRARAAPPQEPARAQQRPRSTPSRSTTSPRCCWEPARGRSRRRASPPTATRARFDAAQPPYTRK